MRWWSILGALVVTIVSGWSQAHVDFRNGVTMVFNTQADRLVYFDRVGGTPLVGTNYVAQLWYVSGAGNGALLQGTQGNHADTLFPFRPPTTAYPGTWSVPRATTPLLAMSGVDVYQWATLQVRVWDSSKYSTFAAAFTAGEYGASAPFDYFAELEATDRQIYMENLRAFALIPEPATLAFCVLAGAGFWVVRRFR